MVKDGDYQLLGVITQTHYLEQCINNGVISHQGTRINHGSLNFVCSLEADSSSCMHSENYGEMRTYCPQAIGKWPTAVVLVKMFL